MDRLTKERLRVHYVAIRPWTRHSLVLLVAGLTYLGIGFSYMSEVVVTPQRERALVVILNLMSFQKWGFVFMVVGALTLVSARWPPIFEKWGYSMLTGLSAGWAAGYFFSLIFAGAPITNLTATLVWSLVAFLWWAISGLVNPPSRVVMVEHGSS